MSKLFSRERMVGMLSPIMIILASLFVVTVLLLAIGVSPLATYSSMVDGAFGSAMGFINTVLRQFLFVWRLLALRLPARPVFLILVLTDK